MNSIPNPRQSSQRPMLLIAAAIVFSGAALWAFSSPPLPAPDTSAVSQGLLAVSSDDEAIPGDREDPSKSKTVGEALIRLMKRHKPTTSLGPVQAQLDVYELELEESLASAKDANSKVRALVSYFFEEQRFSSNADLASPSHFYVNDVLLTREGYCLSLSAIILAIGERLKLPLFGVASPRHFFLRWDDGKTRINIETTERGRHHPDAFYRAEGITKEAEVEGIYLRSLTTPQIIAHLLNNEGYILWRAGESLPAQQRFRAAIKLHPKLVEAHLNLGVIAAEDGRTEDSKSRFATVLKYLPGDAATLFNQSLFDIREGRVTEGLQRITAAQAKSPASKVLAHYKDLLIGAALRPAAWSRYQDEIRNRGKRLAQANKLKRGIQGWYFPKPDLSGTPYRRVDRQISFEWRYSRPTRRTPADGFSVRWKAWVDIPSDGTWTILTAANDGVRVTLDGIPLINNWKRNEGAVDQGSIPLKAGLHELQVDYFDHVRFAGITLQIKRADQTKALGPESFFHQPDSAPPRK